MNIQRLCRRLRKYLFVESLIGNFQPRESKSEVWTSLVSNLAKAKSWRKALKHLIIETENPAHRIIIYKP